MEQSNTIHKQILTKAIQDTMEKAKVPMKVHLVVVKRLESEIKAHNETKKNHETQLQTYRNHVDKKERDHNTQIVNYEKQIETHKKEAERLQTIARGEKGDIGEKGESIRGQDGRTPVKGVDYFDGINGKDGKSVNIQDIIDGVIKMIKEKKFIDISHIRNAQGFVKDSIKYKVEELMHGAGKASLTVLPMTETPNGILKVFTIPGATAKPSYIVVDNAWERATTVAGTVNWTWNAGLKQITLSVPATDDIFAIV